MNILLTFDNGYTPHAAVVMESIIANCNNAKGLTFYVLYNEISLENQNALKKHFSSRIKEISFIKVKDYEFKGCENCKSLAHIKNSKNVLLRLFLDKIPSDDWILYLDCDIIVQDDITKLKEFYDDEKVIGAITEYNASYKLRDISSLSKYEYPSFIDPFQYEAYWYRALTNLDMNLNGKYFCAGVMLVNLKLWKRQNFGEKILNYILAKPKECFALDQDALNHQVNGDYIELPPRWGNNVIYDAVFTNYSTDELKEALENPAIIHIAGNLKPWMYRCNKKYKSLYQKYRKMTPWPEITYPDKTLKNIFIMKFINPIISILGFILNNRLKETIKFYNRFNSKNYFSCARINKK